MPSLSADNRHIGRYIVQSADDRIYADYLQYRIGRISVSANFPNLDIDCTLSGEVKVDALNVLGRVRDRMIHDSL